MGMKCTIWGTQSVTEWYLCMLTQPNHCAYCSDHFEMYRNIRSLCYLTEN